MVNLYDSPAQAQFINTYVPIQFDNLYRLSEKAAQDIKEGNQLLDTLYKYKSLNSISEKDNSDWSEITRPAFDFVNENVKDQYSLQDPLVKNKLNSIIRTMSSDSRLNKLVDGKKYLDEYVKAADPKWGGIYASKAKSYSTLNNGLIVDKPLDFSDWSDYAGKLTKDMKPRVISSDGFYDVYGNDQSDINKIISNATPAILSDESLQLRADKDLSDGVVSSEYLAKDANGNIVNAWGSNEARTKYMIDQVESYANQRTIGRTKELNQVRWGKYQQDRQDARLRMSLEARERKEKAELATQMWLTQAGIDITNKKYNSADNKIAIAIKGKIGQARESAGASVFGENMWIRYKANENIGVLSGQRVAYENKLATAQANKDQRGIAAAKAGISAIDRRISDEKSKVQAAMPGAENEIRSAVNFSTVNPGRGIFTPGDINSFTSTTANDILLDEWMDVNVGEKEKISDGPGAGSNMYRVTNPSNIFISAPGTVNKNVGSSYNGTGKFIPSIRGSFFGDNNGTNGGVYTPEYINNVSGKLNELIQAGSLGRDVYMRPNGKIKMAGGESYASGTILIRKEALEKSFSPKEMDIIYGISGAKNEVIRKEGKYVNSKGEAKATVYNYNYIAIPAGANFINTGGKDQFNGYGLQEAVVDSKLKLNKENSYNSSSAYAEY